MSLNVVIYVVMREQQSKGGAGGGGEGGKKEVLKVLKLLTEMLASKDMQELADCITLQVSSCIVYT